MTRVNGMYDVFTYGSLMEADIMEAVAGTCVNAGAAVLHGYRCLSVKGEAYPGVIPLPGHSTSGVLWRRVAAHGLQQLDVFEGDYYERRPLHVWQENRYHFAWVYVFRNNYRHLLGNGNWSYAGFRQTGKRSFIDQYVGFTEIKPND